MKAEQTFLRELHELTRINLRPEIWEPRTEVNRSFPLTRRARARRGRSALMSED
jgi:hypothetical protein